MEETPQPDSPKNFKAELNVVIFFKFFITFFFNKVYYFTEINCYVP